MDVMKPEIQCIDGICYRINPGNFCSNFERGNLQQYIEPDDIECVIDTVSDDEEFDFEVDGGGRYKMRIHVAKVYFPFIIGSKGLTKKRFETETRTRINVPKFGQNGDIFVTGADKKSVISCRKRIDNLVLSARSKQPFTHFISIPFTDPCFKRGFLEFKAEVLKTCSDSGIDESIFQNVDKLHLTIGILVLSDDVERKAAVAALEKCKENVIQRILGLNALYLSMIGVDCMNDDPSEVNILYGKVVCVDNPSLLQDLADEITTYFVSEGLMEREHEHVKLHVTLMNTSFLGRNKPMHERCQRKAFDARNILQNFKDYIFGEAEISKIELSLRASSAECGYYRSSATITIP